MDPAIQTRLLERQEDRKAALEKRKAERQEAQRVEESIDYFEQHFSEKKKVVTELVERSDDVSRDQISSHFDDLAMKCQELQKYVSDSVLFLTAYSLGQYQQQIMHIQQQVAAKREELMPKKKFAFKSRKKETLNPLLQGTEVKDSAKVVAALSEQPKVGFTDKSQESLFMGEADVQGQDLNLNSLSHCEVKLCGAPSTLHMSNLNNCKILCGPVSSSVFVDDCCDCLVVVACQQLRVHTTKRSTFYVHVTSRSIIEDCSSVAFAPYNWSYPQSDHHFKVAGLDRSTNNWTLVDDFNWLASTDPSPNWHVLPEQERTVFT